MAIKKTQLAALRSTNSSSVFGQMIKAFPQRTRIIAEGDSWFAYPKKNLLLGKRSNVISQFKMKGRFNLLQLSSNGDEAVQMLTGSNKLRLIRLLARHEVDILLFSGGGNDLVGQYDFDFFLKSPRECTGYTHWSECIREERLKRRLQLIKSVYTDLVEWCQEYSKNPDIKVVTHGYDFAVPSPTGAVFLNGLIKINQGRSWMHPYLVARGITRRADQKAIVRHLMGRLGDNHSALANQAKYAKNFVFADTRNTVAENEWLNEIHPTPAGFKKVTDKIYAACRPHLR